jgi:arylsulfatase A
MKLADLTWPDGVFAFRSGPWKLVEGTGRKPHELYNLADDPGETRNLAAEQPGRVAELAAALAKARSNSRTRPCIPQPKDKP